jgi:endonuclease/exonuclease/phosphatase (EEP) superfamily protein YafD
MKSAAPTPALAPTLVLALALLAPPAFSSQGSAPRACRDEPCIQVGSFNLEYLGQRGRSREQVEALADLVAEHLDLEVVALQEIDTGSEAWGWLRESLAARGYRFFEGTTSGRSQFVVLAWDSDEVELTPGSARELPTDTGFTDPDDPACAYEGLRRPVAARFSAGDFDFWVVGVHMKSRYRGTPPDAMPLGCPSWIRDRQADQLVRQVDALIRSSGEEDVVLAGDFNELAGDDSLRPLRMADFASQMVHRMPGSRAGSYLPAGDHDLIDLVWILEYETREVAPGSGSVFVPADAEAFIETMSDHVPVWASFHTGEDLDRASPSPRREPVP